MSYLNYLKLLKLPILKPLDKFLYLACIIVAIVPVIFIAVFAKKSIKQAIFLIFPKLMPKDLLMSFYGVKFKARKGKTDILVLNELSEPWMKDYFRPKKGEIVLDIGAHVGKYTLPAAKLVGNQGKVIAVEAHPENFKALLENIRLNGFNNVIPLNFAAYNQDYVRQWLSGSSDDNYSVKYSGKDKIEVMGRTVDSMLQELGIKAVDWVKIDVEGAEVEVLEGMKDTIENSPKLKICVEVHRENKIKVDTILNGFSNKTLGGDSPECLVIFYWKNK